MLIVFRTIKKNQKQKQKKKQKQKQTKNKQTNKQTPPKKKDFFHSLLLYLS